MPGTPSVRADAVDDIDAAGLVHSSCPPEDDRDDSYMLQAQIQVQMRLNVEGTDRAIPASSLNTPPRTAELRASTPQNAPVPSPHIKMDVEMESRPGGMMSPVSIGTESKSESEKGDARVRTPINAQPMTLDNYTGSSSSMDYQFSNVRLLPSSPSSFLRPGSKFIGTQKSDKQEYAVHVEVKQVDMRESYMCGFLKIEGLTEDHPSLTTFFEGEIIGSKYTFLTKHTDWGASRESDLQHWDRFPDFVRHYKKPMQTTGKVTVSDPGQQKTIFMRWKEHFLVPDHRVRTITGASFEGFYYIAFDQVTGAIEGTYFHAKSERFQKLVLEHVPDRGAFPAFEMR